MSFNAHKEKAQDRAIADVRNRVVNKPIIAGQIGIAQIHPTGPVVLKFNEFWASQGGITYNSGTGEFTVPEEGVYRITMNPFKRNTSGATEVLIGINNLAPSVTNHRGHCYSNTPSAYNTMCLDSAVALNAGDKIVFYLRQGTLYNASTDKFNQFTIEKIN